MITQLSFQPGKASSRLAYFKKAVSIVIVFSALSFFKVIIHHYKDFHLIMDGIVYGLIAVTSVIIALRDKIITGITIDHKKNELIVSYFTISKLDRCLVIPFSEITYEYKLIETRYKSFTVLRIYRNYEKVISIAENQDGWSLETLEEIHAQLELSSIY